MSGQRNKTLSDEELTIMRERAEKVTGEAIGIRLREGRPIELVNGYEEWIADVGTTEDADFIVVSYDYVPKLLAEIDRLRHAISWGVSCVGCSNQLAEEWDIIEGSFVCQECIDYGGDSE